MDLIHGCYYRRKEDGIVVKILHGEVWPAWSSGLRLGVLGRVQSKRTVRFRYEGV